MSEVKHTPLPWGIEQTSAALWIGSMRPDGMKVGSVVTCLDNSHKLTVERAQQNYLDARLIVQAVNSHGDLVEALREARTTLSITRTNIMCEMQKGEGTAYRFEGVPEILKQRIDQIDTALSKVLELGEGL